MNITDSAKVFIENIMKENEESSFVYPKRVQDAVAQTLILLWMM